MQLILTVAFLSLFYMSGIAQTRPAISGRVTDDAGKPLPGATIMLKHAKDTQLVKATVSDTVGHFRLETPPPGKYLLQTSFITYQTRYLPLTLPGNGQHTSLLISLLPTDKHLQGVTIKGRKPGITIDPGKTTVNVAQSTVAQSQSAFELLKDIPGVTVNKDGEISVRGKKGVTVMLDGELVNMSASQLKNLLKSTPGTTIQQIEVLNNPPASMDAAGNAGVLNIVFRKKVQKGFSGTITSGVGWGQYAKTDHTIAMNYGTGKWNLAGSYAFSFDRSWYQDSTHRDLSENGKPYFMEQVQRYPERLTSHTARLGIDRFLGDHHTISLQLAMEKNAVPYSVPGMTRFFGEKGLVDSTTSQVNNSLNPQTNITGSLQYKWKVREGRNFSASLHTARLRTDAEDLYTVENRNSKGELSRPVNIFRNRYPGSMDFYTFRSDYLQEIRINNQKAGKWETGIKGSTAATRYEQITDDKKDAQWIRDTRQSNRFRFREDILAAYASGELNIKKWELMAGLRTEYTNTTGDSASDRTLVQRNYWSLFPNVRVGYKASDNYKISLSYNRRIERPDYQAMNPAVRVWDPYTLETGNPYLKPQFSNDISLSQQFFKYVDLVAGYNLVTDAILFVVTRPEGALQAVNTNVNAARQHNYYASLSFPLPLPDWWQNYNSIYINVAKYNTQLIGQHFDEKAVSFGFSINNSITLPADLTLELNGWYTGGGLYGNMRYRPMAEVSLGISKQLWEEKANIGFSLSDIFYNNVYRADIAGKETPPMYFQSKYESRVAKFTFTWRFGKKQGAKNETVEEKEEEETRLPKGNRQGAKPGGF